MDGIHVKRIDIGKAVAFCQFRITVAAAAGTRKVERIDPRFRIAFGQDSMRIAVAIETAGKRFAAVSVHAAAVGGVLGRMAGVASYLLRRQRVGESADIRMTTRAADSGMYRRLE